jgi:acyl carrier protein
MKEQAFKMKQIELTSKGDKPVNNPEIIKTRSGEWYSISQKDMAIFIKETKQILQKHISHGNTVGLFLDLDSANFNSMVLYQACIACGASVIRCGISDFDRQLPVKNDIILDLLICTPSAFKYVNNKLKYNVCILINPIESIEGQSLSLEGINIYEFFNIPGFLIANPSLLLCAGYTVSEYNDAEKTLCIQTANDIEGFKINDYYLSLSLPTYQDEKHSSDLAHDYIKLQIKIMLKEVLNGKVDCQGNIKLTSIGMVELLVRLEEEFGIPIPMEKINKSSFENMVFLSELIYSTVVEG